LQKLEKGVRNMTDLIFGVSSEKMTLQKGRELNIPVTPGART
jgi:hypothetical protein